MIIEMIKAHPTERRMRSKVGLAEQLTASRCQPKAAGWVDHG
jgi:hypothetical protein